MGKMQQRGRKETERAKQMQMRAENELFCFLFVIFCECYFFTSVERQQKTEGLR